MFLKQNMEFVHVLCTNPLAAISIELLKKKQKQKETRIKSSVLAIFIC